MPTECVTPQQKKLEKLKLSQSIKSATADNFIITENLKKQCRMLRSL